MRVVNIHKRTINQPKEKVSELFRTLATKEDMIWPYENWPAIRFKDGLTIGSHGGHGLIKYKIVEFIEGEFIKFQFLNPVGFNGTHELNITSTNETKTEIAHKIIMRTSFRASLLWAFAIRWLHDALIEEAFDKVENYFLEQKKQTEYKTWVKFLRRAYKRDSFKNKHV